MIKDLLTLIFWLLLVVIMICSIAGLVVGVLIAIWGSFVLGIKIFLTSFIAICVTAALGKAAN